MFCFDSLANYEKWKLLAANHRAVFKFIFWLFSLDPNILAPLKLQRTFKFGVLTYYSKKITIFIFHRCCGWFVDNISKYVVRRGLPRTSDVLTSAWLWFMSESISFWELLDCMKNRLSGKLLAIWSRLSWVHGAPISVLLHLRWKLFLIK